MQQLTERVEIELDDVTDVDIAMVAGELSIAEGQGPLRLEGEVIEGPPLAVEMSGGAVRIRHQGDGVLGLVTRRLRANVRLRVPIGSPVHAAVVSADVLLDGLTGRTTGRTVSGDLTATALTGGADLRTVSGDIALQRIDGSLVVGTVSGDITISDGRLTQLTGRTVSGDVMADLAWTPESIAELTTVSGDVVLRIPGTSGVRFEATTLSGNLRCDLPLVVDHADRRRLAGTAGDGSGEIVARTTSGDVMVLGR